MPRDEGPLNCLMCDRPAVESFMCAEHLKEQRIIDAAPEMLRVLCEVRDELLDLGFCGSEALAREVAGVIAKAEGRRV